MLIKSKDLETIKKLDLKHPYVWLATWFGSGFFRPAPGTWGSLFATPPALMIHELYGMAVFLMALAFITMLGFWASERFEAATDSHDNSMIVIDEAVGQWITLIPVFVFYDVSALWVLVAFVLFRVFDITKPWPVSYFDRHVDGAAGVMMDDVVAGIMAAAVIVGAFYAGFG